VGAIAVTAIIIWIRFFDVVVGNVTYSRLPHLRTRPGPSLCFSMGLLPAPQTGKPVIAQPKPTVGASRMTIGSRGAIGWAHHCSTHGDRGQRAGGYRVPVDHFWWSRCVFF
jgi:hypothetical protein